MSDTFQLLGITLIVIECPGPRENTVGFCLTILGIVILGSSSFYKGATRP